MKDFLHLRILALIVVGLMVVCPRAGAQGLGFGLSVTPSATSMLVSNSLTYTINVTNQTGIPLLDVLVTNLLPASVRPLSATNSQGSATNYGSVVVFDLGGLNIDVVALLTLTVQPMAAGFITNTVTVTSTNIPTASTNVVVQVTNALIITADLGVMMTGSVQPVITNDWMTYGVSVTNAGPDAAPNVMLTNTLPPGVGFISVSPASPAPSIVGSNVIFNLGTLASGAFTNFLLTVQPTNAGVLSFSSFVFSAGVTDPDLADNSASTNITITGYLSGLLVAFTNSAQIYNPQNGLIEQSITLSNAGPSSVASARVVVTSLTNQLANAVGTNAGNPFVVFSSALNSGQTVFLLLQYYLPNRSVFPFSNSQLHAFEVPPVVFAAPAPSAMSTNLNLARIVKLTNGNMLIEWPTIVNRAYTVVYSDNVLFSNAMIAPPSVTALGTRLQWVDYGPPTTTSAPTNAPVRFYRVFLNP